MRIKSLTIDDFKGIKHLEINPDGHNVTVTGQNGAGKTSVYHAYLWALGQNIKAVEPIESGGNVFVNLAFDNGKAFRRVLVNGNCKYFIDGAPANATDYKRSIEELFTDKPEMFSKLDYFPTLKSEERRKILMSMCNVDNKDVLAADETLKPLEKYLTVDEAVLRTKFKTEIRDLQADLDKIPAEIKGLRFNDKVRIRDDAEYKTKLNAEIAQAEADLSKIEVKIREPHTTAKDIDILEVKIANAKARLRELTEDYKQAASQRPGICPTCGQKIPEETFIISRDRQIAKINEKGVKVKHELDEFKKAFDNLKATQGDSENDDYGRRLEETFSEKLRLNDKLHLLKQELNTIAEQERRTKRINELTAEQKELENGIAEFKELLSLLKNFTLSKVRLIESEINSKFQVVAFKLFDYRKTTGEVYEICEVLLDGKPYSDALSKGERLKASLDCLKALQKFYNVELPVFIDDSESYTSNSMIDLPNQTFALRVVEGQELKVEVHND